jgi:hypothetical protein
MHKFSKIHHKLERSRVTPNRLGGFTTKGDKCFMSYLTQPKMVKV